MSIFFNLLPTDNILKPISININDNIETINLDKKNGENININPNMTLIKLKVPNL